MPAASALRKRSERLHLAYAIEKRGELYICFDDCNLAWTNEEIDVYISMWEEGRHQADMYQTLLRPDIEIDALSLCLAYENKIKPRPGGVLGAV